MSRFIVGYNFATRRPKPFGDRDAAECDLVVSVRPGVPLVRVVSALRKLAAFVEKQPDPNEAPYSPATEAPSPAPTNRRKPSAAAVG